MMAQVAPPIRMSLGNLCPIQVPVSPVGVQQDFGRLQAEVSALEARHMAIREANAALRPATLERIFQSEATA
jgi:hypothetical protein